MHPANPAGCEHANARHMGDDHRASYGGCAILTQSDGDGQVTAATLAHVVCLAKPLNVIFRDANRNRALQYGDGRGGGTRLAHGGFHVERGLHVIRVG